jgi:hypothetical protein
MKMVLWLILPIAMFFYGCDDDSTLPESEMGGLKSSTRPKDNPEVSGNPEGQFTPEHLPLGEPAETVLEREGVHFLGDAEKPFSGFTEQRHENGKLAFWASYADGQPHGKQYFWNDNEQMLQEASFSDGKLDGAQTFWWPNGMKKEERIWRQGQSLELRRWAKTGELIEENINF